MRAKPLFLALLALMVLPLLAACRASEGLGRLEVKVTDHREAIGDFAALLVTFSAVGVHPARKARSQGWQELKVGSPPVDLTQYVEGHSATILRGELEAGAYDGVRLDITEIQGILKSGESLQVAQAGDPLAMDFTLLQGRTTAVLVDLVVLDMRDHPGRGYELHFRGASVVK